MKQRRLTSKQIENIVGEAEEITQDGATGPPRTPEEKFRDRRWRLSHLYKIRDEAGNKIIFTPNVAQVGLLDNFWYWNLILKARQLGFTTLTCLLYLDDVLFTGNLEAGIVAHNREDAEEFFTNKVAFGYDNLPEEIRYVRPADTDRSNKLSFSNGSSIRVGTSLRSGTIQRLLISEFGKICAKYPDRAREIVTGSLNTVHAGQIVCCESTAEGRAGYFYDYVQEAHRRDQAGTRPNPLQWKLHFFPWWKHPRYYLDPTHVFIPKDLEEYFNLLEVAERIRITPEQRAWYAAKKETQGEDMFREYPSTIEEAFYASVQGAYYKDQMAIVRGNRQIGRMVYDPSVPVSTGWDIGMSDMLVIWFHQYVAREHRIIDYLELNSTGYEEIVRILMNEKKYNYATHYLPHDTVKRDMRDARSGEDILRELGLRNVVVVPRTNDLSVAIDDTRRFLVQCFFDPVNCEIGINHLDGYTREWDDRLGMFKNQPLHNACSHGADGYRTLAAGIMSGMGGESKHTPLKRPQGRRGHMTA